MQSEGDQRPTGPGWRAPWPMWGSLKSSAAPPARAAWVLPTELGSAGSHCLGPPVSTNFLPPRAPGATNRQHAELVHAALSSAHPVQHPHTVLRSPALPKVPSGQVSFFTIFLLVLSSSPPPLHPLPSPLPTSQTLHQGTVSHSITQLGRPAHLAFCWGHLRLDRSTRTLDTR